MATTRAKDMAMATVMVRMDSHRTTVKATTHNKTTTLNLLTRRTQVRHPGMAILHSSHTMHTMAVHHSNRMYPSINLKLA